MRRGKNIVKGIIMAALSLTMVLASLPAMPTTVLAANYLVTDLSDFSDLVDGGIYTFNSDVTLEGTIEVNNVGITIDLHGRTVTVTSAGTQSLGAIWIKNGGAVILNDSVGGGKLVVDKNGIINDGGTVTINGGVISGGDIYGIRNNDGGTVTFNAGTIENMGNDGIYNYNGTVEIVDGIISSCEVGVENYSNLNSNLRIAGGKIIDNRAGGIRNRGTLAISGAPTITGNVYEGRDGNIVLHDSTMIEVGAMTNATPIGVARCIYFGGTTGTKWLTGVFTTGGNAAQYRKNFKSDYESYYVVKNGNELELSTEEPEPDVIINKEPSANDNLFYTGKPQELVTTGTVTGGKMKYALGKDSTNAPANGWSEAIPTATDAGTYYVWYKAVSEDGLTETDPECIEVTIDEAETDIITKAPLANGNLTYTGKQQELVTAGEAKEGMVLQYALGENAAAAPTTGWSTSIPTAIEDGTYYVWYKAVSEDGLTETDPVCIEVTIKGALLVVKDRSNISGMFKKFGEKNYKYRFKIEDSAQRKIARVNRKGKIKVKKVGTVKVSLFRKVKGGTWTKVEEQAITTEKPEIPKKITTLKIGDKVNITSFIKNNDKMINKPTSYLSSKPEVASIDSTGNITVKKSGRTKISIIYGKGQGAAVYKVKLKI